MSEWRGTWVMVSILTTYCLLSTVVGWFGDALVLSLACNLLVCLATAPMIARIAKLETNEDKP